MPDVLRVVIPVVPNVVYTLGWEAEDCLLHEHGDPVSRYLSAFTTIRLAPRTADLEIPMGSSLRLPTIHPLHSTVDIGVSTCIYRSTLYFCSFTSALS